MSLQSRTLLRHALMACLFTVVVPSYSYAENISNFESAYAKVQSYQVQAEIARHYAQISDLNIRQSQLWQNPSLTVEQSGFGSDHEQEFSLGIRQPLDIFGQRKLSQAIANTSGQQLQLQQQLWNAQSQLIVRYAWSQLTIAETERTVYASQLRVSKANLESAQKRYQAGSIALVDYERAQIEALEMERLYQQAVLNQQSVGRQLSNLWGETYAQTDLSKTSIPWPDQSNQTVQHYISEGWLEKLYALNIRQSNYRIERLKVQARPQPALNVGMNRTRSPDENNEMALTLGVDLPLNLFDRQQYAIPIAQQQQILLNQQQQRELKQQILDIANSMHQLKALRNQYELITSQIDLAEKVQSRTLQGFKAGKLSITDVQQATSQLHSLRLAMLQTLRQAWQSALGAEALSIGTSYEEISRSDAYIQLNQNAAETLQNLINEGTR